MTLALEPLSQALIIAKSLLCQATFYPFAKPLGQSHHVGYSTAHSTLPPAAAERCFMITPSSSFELDRGESIKSIGPQP
jgi:hypothetical protein